MLNPYITLIRPKSWVKNIIIIIPFLLGKVGNSLYKDYENGVILPIANKQSSGIFDFIHKTEKYADLSKFIIDNKNNLKYNNILIVKNLINNDTIKYKNETH